MMSWRPLMRSGSEERPAVPLEATPAIPSEGTPSLPVGKGIAPPSEPLVNSIWQLLQQHQFEIGRYLDNRLATHHELLFRRLAGEQISFASPSPLGPRLTPQQHSGDFREDAGGSATGQQVVTLQRTGETAQREDSSSIGPRLVHLQGPSESAQHQEESLKSTRVTSPPETSGEDSTRRSSAYRSKKTDTSCFESAEQAKRDRSRTVYTPSTRRSPSQISVQPLHSWMAEARKHCRKIIGSRCFEVIVCTLIVTNVMFLGYEVQSLIDIADDEPTPRTFRVIEYTYTTCFTIELCLRVFAGGIGAFCREEDRYWNILDLCLVLVSLMEVAMDILQDINPQLEYLRIIRMARTIRILRVVRIMKFFRPLRILAISVMNTVRSLAWTVVLLAMVIYLFALLFTLAATQGSSVSVDFEDLESNFGSLWTTIVTLFKAITGGMDWEVCVNVLKEIHLFWPSLFIGYIAFCQLALLNVVTGVVCQTAIESARQDQDIVIQTQLAAKQHYVEQFQELFSKFDADRSGSITLEEFESLLQEPSWKEYFAAMDLTVDEAWNLFKLLDLSENCSIDVDEFVSGCLKLRGTARSLDVHMLMYQNKWTMKKMAQMMSTVDDLRVSLGGPPRATMAKFSF